MLLGGGQPANMSAAKIDWLPAEGGHGQLPQGGGGPGDVGLGVRGLRWGRALVLEELGVRGGSDLLVGWSEVGAECSECECGTPTGHLSIQHHTLSSPHLTRGDFLRVGKNGGDGFLLLIHSSDEFWIPQISEQRLLTSLILLL